MHIRREYVDTTTGHARQGPAPVDAYTLDNGGGFQVTVWTYGATLVEVLAPDRDGAVDNVVHRLPRLADYEDRAKNAYVGATVGRFCRNVAHGTFELDGVKHELDRNEGDHHIHGGTFGFDTLVWTAETERTEDHAEVRLTLDSPDGDQGYPGDVRAETVYRLGADSTLTLEFRATTTAGTLFGLTNHAYWNLAGGQGARTIDGHELTVGASRVLRFDDDLLPVPGPPAPTEGTPLDLTEPRTIGSQRLDNFFVLDDPERAAELYDPASGRGLRMSTDQTGVGIYSADGLRPPRVGLCLETGAWPDAPNRPDFPSARLDPGEVHLHRTRYAFFTR